jgi:uncharacterized protein
LVYIKTYLERAVSDLVHVGNLTTFRTFRKLVAYKCGSQINYTDISNDLNISVNTVKTWMTILESSYIIHQLPLFHKNYGKRLLKSPKLYFYDTALLCHLLGLHDNQKLMGSEKYGIIFENMIVAETIKYKSHLHLQSDLFFFRDSNGMEIDLLEMIDLDHFHMIEIKSGSTFKQDFLKNMKKIKALDSNLNMNVVYNGKENFSMNDYKLSNWRQMHTMLE